MPAGCLDMVATDKMFVECLLLGKVEDFLSDGDVCSKRKIVGLGTLEYKSLGTFR